MITKQSEFSRFSLSFFSCFLSNLGGIKMVVDSTELSVFLLELEQPKKEGNKF